ncbi:unnamed protein product [Didymodactylos carnosus]|uniref:Uncharacterized protein n=1 Tax=Didymodactylos carnosus TaxID=1234261 RepID=A0A815ABN4_9BILA|nr:unnamed protein product [Didymodactylos carnosus]CAF1254660.1 unnamed protein product [Didymodactylos carnosus]CAF3824586.1 unnamed protein product [Didymodactylos carnosus]CAF4026202.1 unnamed protein product [Didymodactylos carnosus]
MTLTIDISSVGQTTSPPPPDIEMSRTNSSSTAVIIDWKEKYEQLHIEHQLEVERIRQQYEHELRDKITGLYISTIIYVQSHMCLIIDIRSQLKHDYDYRVNDLRQQYEQLQLQQQHNLSLNSTMINDNSFGEQIREQLRIAKQYENDEQKTINSLLLTQQHQLIDENDNNGENLKRLVSRLHTEGTHVRNACSL